MASKFSLNLKNRFVATPLISTLQVISLFFCNYSAKKIAKSKKKT